MNYFIVDNGQQAGPYTIDELVKRGLNSDTLVWAEGMTDWTPAWQVEELKNYLYGQQTPPPPPTNPAPQSAYVQPEYEPAPEPTPEKPKKKGKGCGTTMLWIGLAIILFAAILLGTTCPDRNKHQEVIQENITSPLTGKVLNTLIKTALSILKARFCHILRMITTTKPLMYTLKPQMSFLRWQVKGNHITKSSTAQNT